MSKQTETAAPPVVGVNVRIPAAVHRAAKVACAERDRTWDEAVAEALEAWARRSPPRTK